MRLRQRVPLPGQMMFNFERRLNQDDRWMLAVIDGDQQVFARMMDQYQAMLKRWVRELNHKALLEDTLQAVWLRVWERRKTYRFGSFRGWLWRITRSIVIDGARADGRRGGSLVLGEQEGRDRSVESRDLVAIRDDRDLLVRYLRGVNGEWLDDVLPVLSGQESIRGCAERCGVSENVVRWRVSQVKARACEGLRGNRKLARVFGEYAVSEGC
jgi:DNA-directed RNA polymerase specialized sigma24 family protein